MVARAVASWGGRAGRSRRRAPAAVQEALFEVTVRPELRFYRQIMEALARSGFGLAPAGAAANAPGAAAHDPAAGPLEAELVVSKLLGTVWAGQTRRDGELEEAFGLGLVDHARQRHTPVAVALLRTVAAVAPTREVRTAAARAADGLVAGGLPEPGWSPPVGVPVPGRCWAFEDVFGDHSTVICEYAYLSSLDTEARHAVVIFVDHARLSVATDLMITPEVDALIRDMTNEAKNSHDVLTLRRVEPAWARALLSRAYARTDLIDGIVVEPSYADLRAVAMARLDLLPSAPGFPITGVPPSLAADFLGSVEARALTEAGATVAVLVGDFFSRYEQEQLLVGPARWEVFVDDFLPSLALDAEQAATVPQVVRAWSAWAERLLNLPSYARAELSACLDELFPA